MQYEVLRDALLPHVYTEREFRHTLSVLQAFLESRLFSSSHGTSIREQLRSFFETRKNEEYAKIVLDRAGDDFYQVFTVKNAYDVLQGIERSIELLPIVTLYVPIELPHQSVSDIGKWLRDRVHSQTLMQIIVEPDVAAGCALVKDGIYHDFSFRYFLHTHDQQLLESIHEHIHAA